MRQWLRQLWKDNVIVDQDNTLGGHLAEMGDGDWEPVECASEPVMRCRRCGDLVRAAYLSEHLAESHQQRVVATIRLFDDGDSQVIATDSMRLMPNHVRTIRGFLETQNNALLADAVAEIRRTGAQGQAELMKLLAADGPVQ